MELIRVISPITFFEKKEPMNDIRLKSKKSKTIIYHFRKYLINFHDSLLIIFLYFTYRKQRLQLQKTTANPEVLQLH